MEIFRATKPSYREVIAARIKLPLIGPIRIEVPVVISIKRGR